MIRRMFADIDADIYLLVDGDGKELLQYVAPREFSLLRDPLRAMESAKPLAQ